MGRYDNALAQAIEGGLDNVALAIEENRVGEAVVMTFDATRRVVAAAIADGIISRREQANIRTHLAVLGEGLAQVVALDRQDAEVARGITGAHEELARRRHEARGADLAVV